MSVNVISMSLWGNVPMYIRGAFENVILWKKIYPDWKLRFYIDKSVDMSIAKELHNKGAEVFLVENTKGSFHGMYWRMLVNDDPSVSRFIIRDSDSRLNYREKVAVDEWIKSDKSLHIMRDHPHHRYPIQGGMWGAKTGIIDNIESMINDWGKFDYFACDQEFLAKYIYPKYANDAYVNDEFYEKKPFPTHEPLLFNGKFVGEKFNEENIPLP